MFDMILAFSQPFIPEPVTHGTHEMEGFTNFSKLQSVHATVLTMSADDPLLHSQTTTLEREHASLVLGQAHAADRVLALRMLDTGTAKDVSGVVRITRGGGGGGAGAEDEEEDEGKEYLYHVTGDGGVRVFERGT
jgi:elongator complex protein 6